MSVFKRNHWGMGLLIDRIAVVNNMSFQGPLSGKLNVPVLAGSLSKDTLRAERFLGRLSSHLVGVYVAKRSATHHCEALPESESDGVNVE